MDNQRPNHLPTLRDQLCRRADTALPTFRPGQHLGPGTPSAAAGFLMAVWQAQTQTTPKVALAEDPRQQEHLASDLLAWGGTPFLLPEPTDETAILTTDTGAERWAAWRDFSTGQPGWLLCTAASLDQPVPATDTLHQLLRILRPGQRLEIDTLLTQLDQAGYLREGLTVHRGQFSRRGGILDIFPWQATEPVRIEWFGNEIESIRAFDPETGRSTHPLNQAEIFLGQPEAPADWPTLRNALGTSPALLHLGGPPGGLEDEFLPHTFLHGTAWDPVLQENRRQRLRQHLQSWLAEDWHLTLVCQNEGERERLREWLAELGINPNAPGLTFPLGPLLQGFSWPRARIAVLTDAEIFSRYQTLRPARRRSAANEERRRVQALDFSDLAEGDYVVHADHGIALYGGLQTVPDAGHDRQVLVLIFAGGARLFVPLEQAFLVSRYIGAGKRHPPLDQLGGSRWERTKAGAQRAVLDYAAHLLRLQAERATLPGTAMPPDSAWQREFEDSFFHQPTSDQLRAIAEVKRDMESPRPMDRLICGDVGFGKTEVAIRAAFKAVQAGFQVAFLAPTTVLASQHARTLAERMADYPITLGILSRLRTPAQQARTLTALADGSLDIVVGTHRLISKDVTFKKLGLVIIDEEQRFGVKQKEHLKERFKTVDVLTLSATPIPRTLYLSLVGARDMSTIDTPPKDRLPVETQVAPYDERLIRTYVQRELARGGQVYYLHNRIGTINQVAAMLKMIAPQARIDIGHGQMPDHQLEDVMARMVDGTTDILVATTIIESGVDIPNANTIIIDRADRFGLADLYQLRGRVGRAQNRAYALLLLPRDTDSGDAAKRVRAIREYQALGSGYKIAMRDLEIRGAGNLLGTAQSGHIAAIGFDLYCRLLKKAVASLKGETSPDLPDVHLSLDFLTLRSDTPSADTDPAFIPADYMTETAWRVTAYRELAELTSLDQWQALRKKWKDLYGRWPDPVELLLAYHHLRLRAALTPGLTRIETKGDKLMITRFGDFVMIGARFPRLTATTSSAKLKEIGRWIDSLHATANPASPPPTPPDPTRPALPHPTSTFPA
ncbi:MAG: transcription-repair coupling factor [Verrucomicrobiia bacterium]